MASNNFSNINLRSGTVFNKHYSGIYSKKEKLITPNKQKRKKYQICQAPLPIWKPLPANAENHASGLGDIDKF